MKNFLLFLTFFGMTSLSTVTAQKFQESRPHQVNCSSISSIDCPPFVIEGEVFKIGVKPLLPGMVKYVDLYVGRRYIGRRSAQPFYLNVDSKEEGISDGYHQIKAKLVTKCGNSRVSYKQLKVKRFR